MNQANKNKQTRKIRTRARIARFSDRTRLSVFRSDKHIYAQIIDSEGKILASASDLKLSDKISKTEKAKLVGQEIAKLAKAKKITSLVFDRGEYKYHGRVKALCEAVREAKLNI